MPDGICDPICCPLTARRRSASMISKTTAFVILALFIQGIFIFQGFAVLFSIAGVAAGYQRLKRWFEAAFAIAFGFASFKLLTAKLFD